MIDRIRERCGCGAVWEGPSTHTYTLSKFREAHAVCRARRETDEQIHGFSATDASGKRIDPASIRPVS